jgi:hypothetical protein
MLGRHERIVPMRSGSEENGHHEKDIVCTLRSCGFLWLIDPRRRSFLRLPSEWPLDLIPPPSTWWPYHRVEIDAAEREFTITLSIDGPVLRTVLHRDPCPFCCGRRPVDRVSPGLLHRRNRL